MRIVAVIEARMNSSRLPGKVLMKWRDKYMLQVMIERLAGINVLNEIVVATTTNPLDDALVEALGEINIPAFRGSEQDVLQRVTEASLSFGAEAIVSLTGDCPLIDPKLVEDCIYEFITKTADVVSNCRIRSFPIGMDTQIFSQEIISLANAKAFNSEEREHTGLFLERHNEQVKFIDIVADPSHFRPELGLVLDEEKDYMFIKTILDCFAPNLMFSCQEILNVIDDKEVLVTNQSIKRRTIN